MKTIKQKVTFNVPPHALYEALMNPEKHARFTASYVTNDMRVGGDFTAYDGYAFGKNLKLKKDKKIVQSWSTTDFPDVITEITFEFKKKGEGTELFFTQKGVPDKFYAEIFKGWTDFYWLPLKRYLER